AAEAGATPAISRAFGQWVPIHERARAQGIFFAGMSAGSALAPPLVTVLMLAFGWRFSFRLLGVVGLVWAVCWYRRYRDKEPAAGTAASSKVSIEWPALL